MISQTPQFATYNEYSTSKPGLINQQYIADIDQEEDFTKSKRIFVSPFSNTPYPGPAIIDSSSSSSETDESEDSQPRASLLPASGLVIRIDPVQEEDPEPSPPQPDQVSSPTLPNPSSLGIELVSLPSSNTTGTSNASTPRKLQFTPKKLQNAAAEESADLHELGHVYNPTSPMVHSLYSAQTTRSPIRRSKQRRRTSAQPVSIYDQSLYEAQNDQLY